MIAVQFKDAVCVNKLSIVRFAFIVVLASVVSEERFETMPSNLESAVEIVRLAVPFPVMVSAKLMRVPLPETKLALWVMETGLL